MEIYPIGLATAVEGQAFRLETGTGRLAAAVNPLDLVLDYGRTQVGQVELKVRGHGVLRLRYGEDLEEALVVDDPYPSTFWYVLPKDDFVLTGDVQEVRCAGRRAWRFLNVHLDAGGACEILSLPADDGGKSAAGWPDDRLRHPWRRRLATDRHALSQPRPRRPGRVSRQLDLGQLRWIGRWPTPAPNGRSARGIW